MSSAGRMTDQEDTIGVPSITHGICLCPAHHAAYVLRACRPLGGRRKPVGGVDAEHALTRKPRPNVRIMLADILVAAHVGATMDEDHHRRAAARGRLVDIENLARVGSIGLVACDEDAI